MRLLDTSSYKLQNFLGDVPPYAILSHTWGEEEVTYDYLSDPKRYNLIGWTKIQQSCMRARNDGWSWIWIDTCCINKADTTELGEAINSMFRWYEAADICYAYLVDVPRRYELSDDGARPGHFRPPDGNGIPWTWCFRSSRWFRRGWTLQELLAPQCLLFLDKEWTDIATRENMAGEIQIATGISTHHLADFRSSSVAAKLSWAADRETTREEDRAYSLLGLFGVNMPLIYGEGSRAFLRLQKELIQDQNDESILASKSGGILGSSPEDFKNASNIVPWRNDLARKTFSTTNVGISLNAELLHSISPMSQKSYYAIQLNCREQLPGFESTASPVFLLLEAEDEALELFNKQTQGSESTIRRIEPRFSWFTPHEWKSLERRDIFITYQSKRESQWRKPAYVTVDFRYWLPKPWDTKSSVMYSFGWDSAKTKTLEVDDLKWNNHDLHFEDKWYSKPRHEDVYPGDFRWTLKSGTISCFSIGFAHLSETCKEHVWLVINTDTSGLPRLGVWTTAIRERVTQIAGVHNEAQRLVGIVTPLPTYQWPTKARLACGGEIIEVSLTASGPRDQFRLRRYRVTCKLVTPPVYTGAIGRHDIPNEVREKQLREEQEEEDELRRERSRYGDSRADRRNGYSRR